MDITFNKITRLTNLLKFVTPFIKSIISLLRKCGLIFKFSISDYEYFSAILIKELKNKGAKSTISLFKQYHRVLTCQLLGHDYDPIPRRRVVKGTKIPKDLGPLMHLLTGTLWDKRLLMTIANMYKILRLPPDPDITPITDVGPEINTDLLESFEDFISDGIPGPILKSSSISVAMQYDFHGYVSANNGPNGPILVANHKDALSLMRDPDLLESVRSLLSLTAPTIRDNLNRCIDKLSKIDTSKILCQHSKVSQLCEGGGKTRNIAIIDYFSQSALNPIHDEILKQLKSNPCDATYSQEDGFSKLMKKANLKGVCYSLDLTSATDRFPLKLQTIVMKQKFGEEIGTLWEKVIALREFTFKDQKIKWGRGQPLGALSSWGAFALTHHLFVRWCSGNPKFDNYIILGDDIAILDERVASIYIDRMTKLGVTINLNKGFSSKGDTVYGEFAKRIFRNEDELTGLPIDLILSARKSIYLIPDFLSFIIRRWKIFLPGPELYAPECFSFLSKKGKQFLRIVLLFRQSLEAKTSLGYPWCALNTEDDFISRVNLYYLTKYSERISTFTHDDVFDQVLLPKLITPLSIKEGNHVSDVVLALIKDKAHPFSLIFGNLIVKNRMTQNELALNMLDYDKLNVEFLPDLRFKAYIYDRKTVRSMNIGKTALKFYYEDMKTLHEKKPSP